MAGRNVDIRMAAGPIVGTDNVNLYTPILDTTEFSWASLQASVDGMLGAAGTILNISPQVSNDGVNWLQVGVGITFNMPGPGPFSSTQILNVPSLAAFLRLSIDISTPGGPGIPVGASISIRATFKTST